MAKLAKHQTADPPSCIAKLLMTNILLLLIILMIYLITTFKSNDLIKSSISTFFNANNISVKQLQEYCIPDNNHEELEEFLTKFRNGNVCMDIDWEKFSKKIQKENTNTEIQIHHYNNDDDRINMIIWIRFNDNGDSLRIMDRLNHQTNHFRYIVQIENDFNEKQLDDYDYEIMKQTTTLEYWANHILILNMTTMALIRFDEKNSDHICLINYHHRNNPWKCV